MQAASLRAHLREPPMEDLLFELLRPLDERDRMRGKRMARAARHAAGVITRRRAAKSLRVKHPRRRRPNKDLQVA